MIVLVSRETSTSLPRHRFGARPHRARRCVRGLRGPATDLRCSADADCNDPGSSGRQLRRVCHHSRCQWRGRAWMHLVDEPGTRRIFVSVMTGQLYSISYDGKVVRGCGEFRERSRNSRYQGGSVLNRKSFRYSSRLDSSSVALPSKRMRPSCRTMNSARATESASAGTIRTRPSSLTAW